MHNAPVRSVKGAMHGFDQHIKIDLPPLSTIYFSVPMPRKRKPKEDVKAAGKPAAKSAAKKPAAQKAAAKPAAKKAATKAKTPKA